jgi:hypothetical protein
MQDEGELVEGQRHPGAEREGEDLQRHPRGREAEREQPGGHHDDHAEDHVVDVRAAGRDVVEPPRDLRADQPRVGAHRQEGEKQADCKAEQDGASIADLGLTKRGNGEQHGHLLSRDASSPRRAQVWSPRRARARHPHAIRLTCRHHGDHRGRRATAPPRHRITTLPGGSHALILSRP